MGNPQFFGGQRLHWRPPALILQAHWPFNWSHRLSDEPVLSQLQAKKKKRKRFNFIGQYNKNTANNIFTVLSWDVLQTLDVVLVCEFELILPYLSSRHFKAALCIWITCMDNLRNFFDAVFLQCVPTMSSGGAVFHSFYSIALFLCYQGPGFDLPVQPFCPKPNDPGAQRSHLWPITNCLHWHCPPIASQISVPLSSRFVPVGSQLHAAKCWFKGRDNGWHGK